MNEMGTIENGKLGAVNNADNGAKGLIEFEEPYVVAVEIVGTAKLLFHRWNVESVEHKQKSVKGSKTRKTDDIESYVYRNEVGEICMPGKYVRGAVVNAAKFLQDPRSPRKSAADLFKAGVVALDELCSLGSKDWEFLDKQKVMVQRNGITRVRPAFHPGWKFTCHLSVLVPEYISAQLLHEALIRAGQLVGLGDDRPTSGRFRVTNFQVVKDALSS